jgi:hypothetical protein
MKIRQIIAKHTATATARPPGSGWERIEGENDSHGGMRKKKTGGGYEYWYPSAKHAQKAAAHHENQASHHVAQSGYGTMTSFYHHQNKAQMHKQHAHGANEFAMAGSEAPVSVLPGLRRSR